MKLKVTVRVINEVRQGVSASSGRTWTNQDVIVSWPEMLADGRATEAYQLCTLHGEMIERFAALNPWPGMQIEADIAFGTRQNNGRVYNDNRLYL